MIRLPQPHKNAGHRRHVNAVKCISFLVFCFWCVLGNGIEVFAQTNETPYATAETRVVLPIPDADPEGVTDTITISGSALLEKLQAAVLIDHPSLDQLSVSLTSPDGTSVLLHNRTPSEENPYRAVYESQTDSAEPLSVFLNENAQGTWVLHVIDSVAGETGTLAGWGLMVKPPDLVSPPPPTPIPLEDNLFFEVSRFTSENQISNVHIADANNDGLDDLMVLSESENKVIVRLSNGTTQFGQPLTFEVDSPQKIKSADLNNDNRLDLIVASQMGDFKISNITVFRGNASGGFTQVFTATVPTALDNLFIFDGNADNIQDIIIGGVPHLLAGVGDGSFAPARIFIHDGRYLLTHTDLNDDGKEDFLMRLSRGGTSPNTDPYVFFGVGDPNYPLKNQVELEGQTLQALDARIQDPSTNEFVVIADTGEVDPTLWFITIKAEILGPVEIETNRLAGSFLNTPIESFDLNGDGLDELVFTSETGIMAFQKTSDSLGGRTNLIFSVMSPLAARPGHFFSDGSAGLVVLTSTDEVILAQSLEGPLPTATPVQSPTPSPTPFLFFTPTPSMVNPTPTFTPLPSPPVSPDLNGDGVVNQLDLLILMDHWGESAQ